MVSKSHFKSSDPRWFLGEVNMNLPSNSDIVNLLLKLKEGGGVVGEKSLIFLLFCFNCLWVGGIGMKQNVFFGV